MSAIFITATGPGVGKTYVAAALIGHLRRMGQPVDAIKPIVSGFDPAHAAASDPGMLLKALGRPTTPEALDRISPWRFRAAVLPDRTARQEGRAIDLDQVVGFCQSAVDRRQGVLLIEGVGGVMTPLDGQHTILDVMMALQLPLVLVTDSHRGAASQTLTALDALFRREMSVLTIAVSDTPSSTVPLDDTVAAIAPFVESVIGVPRQSRESGPTTALARLFGSRRAR